MRFFVLLFAVICVAWILLRVLPPEDRHLIYGPIRRHWWVPFAALFLLGTIVSVLSLFSVKLF